MKIQYGLALMVLAMTLPQLSLADDDPVYESFTGVTIGRVFLGPSDRQQLDARRLNSPQPFDAGAGIATENKPIPKSPPSAGYIIGRSGQSRVWRDGDFVHSGKRAAQAMTFPGDVKITRHRAKENADDDAQGRPEKLTDAGSDKGDSNNAPGHNRIDGDEQ